MTSPRQRYERDPRVDDYIARLPKWPQEICRQLRDLIHAADPEVTEIESGRSPVTGGNGVATHHPAPTAQQ